MNRTPLLLRAVALRANGGVSQYITEQFLKGCHNGQTTFLLQSNVQIPFVHLQQLHSSAAAAVAAATISGKQQAALQGGAAPQSAQATYSTGAGQESIVQLQTMQSSAPLSSLLTGLGSKQMDAQHIGLYYDFNSSLVPEAFQPFQQAFYAPRPAKQQRRGGCRSLQAEFTLSHSSSLMWRRSTQELQQALVSGAVPRVHLKGAAGAGKSIALAQMVEWARSNGWIALYVPSAAELTQGGFFYKRADSNTYDTLISAQRLLNSMAESHAGDLTKLPLQLAASRELLQLPAQGAAAAGSSSSSSGDRGDPAVVPAADEAAAGATKATRKGKKGAAGASSAADVEGTLMQLVVAGLSTDEDGRLAVECCKALIKELAAVSEQQPVLLAVDDYNALYWRTDYGCTVFVTPENGPDYQYRKELRVEQLNLARSMRLLKRSDLGACRVLVADSASNRVPPSVEAPSGSAAVYFMPRFSEVETAHALYYYYERGLIAQPPSAHQVAAMRSLTNGSGTDLRKWGLKVTQTEMGLL